MKAQIRILISFVEITDGQMLIAYYKTGVKVSIVAHKGQYWNL
jgi:hypothetical protein